MAETVLAAEDLVLGYRVDIRRGIKAWCSLCERDAEYKVNGVAIGRRGRPTAAYAKKDTSKRSQRSKDADGALHADDVVVRWNGWSLALPRPNLLADSSGPIRGPNQRAARAAAYEWDFAIPPGRLPALRFADPYQMRVRVADIAGGGLGLPEVDETKLASERRGDLPAP